MRASVAEPVVELPETPFVDGAEVLLESLRREARLTDAGAAAVRRSLTGLGAVASTAARQRAAGVAIRRPVFVTGLHRSGTTLLHRLLAGLPGLRAPALWELMDPAGDEPEDELVGRARAYVDEYAAAVPSLLALHALDARAPEECHRLTATSFRSEIFAIRYRVPSYLRWLRDQDMTVAYRQHRVLMECILRRRPAERVVLKCPLHALHLDRLAIVYPDAVVVRIHRDPRETVPSACSLTAAIRSGRSAHVDPREIGREWIERTDRVVGAMGRVALQVVDVTYTGLIRAPSDVVASIAAMIGTTCDDAAMARVAAVMARKPPQPHRYSADEFGLSAADLGRRYEAYRTEYCDAGVAVEGVR